MFWKKLISQIPNLHQPVMCHRHIYAMDGRTVIIMPMRSDVSVQVVGSNAIVTSLMMVVQGGGDASINRGYVTATTTVMIGRMKSIV